MINRHRNTNGLYDNHLYKINFLITNKYDIYKIT